ncbi:MAG: TraR/DksA family transcriptional regulator [Gemmatimonadota bacterium]|nr:TraR/DksA family transcriptional regulator [Gemmatimonadota bacterium]
MTPDQRKQIEKRLVEERDRATKLLSRYASQHEGESEEEQAGDLTKMPLHMADQGTDTMQQELDAVMVDRESKTLAEIDAALERLYHTPEKFGVCERTGKEIPFERLDIVPWARTC